MLCIFNGAAHFAPHCVRHLLYGRIGRPVRAILLGPGCPGLKAWADRGRDKVRLAPPSEPDWQISCIRLSSWWLTFKKIGMPQHELVLRRTSRLW
jgi:hypothetical protein